MTPALAARRRDYRVIGLIGLAHGFSHFYQLALPALFLLIHEDLGYGFGRLGALTTVFFLVSGLSQIPMGFLVDRYGARPFLFAGLGLLAGATLLCGILPAYWSLVILSVLAGLGNSVFHPVDFSILGATVDGSRMGRAYSVHSITGFVGYAAAPMVLVPLAGLLGWRGALIAAGAAGLALMLPLWRHGGEFRDSRGERAERAVSPASGSGIAVLFRLSFAMYFLFFCLLAFALVAFQTQGPPAISAFHGLPLEAASGTLTAFLIATTLGTVGGGIAVDRSGRFEGITIICLLASALLVLLGAIPGIGATMVITLFFGAGLFFGAFFPARDMLVRAATPRGESGKVFGFVYSGLDLGSTVSPPLFGWFIDRGQPEWTFYGIAIATLLAVLAVRGGSADVRRRAAAEGAP